MQLYYEIAAILLLVIGVSIFMFFRKKPRGTVLNGHPEINRKFLKEHVAFYAKLTDEEKERFENDIEDFLSRIIVTPVNTEITEEDILLIASGAIIPVFRFKNWKYYNLREVLVYADHFNDQFESSGTTSRNIMGMVGDGYMEGVMMLSKPAIEASFRKDGKKTSNTIIHEFVHLIDKVDGDTDGIPKILLERQYLIPWLNMIHREMMHIAEGKSDINVYAYTNKAEFFAVVAEYFFEKPEMLEQNHPDLYNTLNQMFSGNEKAPVKEPGK